MRRGIGRASGLSSISPPPPLSSVALARRASPRCCVALWFSSLSLSLGANETHGFAIYKRERADV